MTQFLLDTHAFLWFVNADSNLSDFARSVIADDANDVFVSVASVWEISIKVGIGKLQIDAPLDDFLARDLPAFEVFRSPSNTRSKRPR